MTTRLTTTNLATVGAAWRGAVKRAIKKQKTSITAVAVAVGCSRQYLARVLEDGPTLPVETYTAVCRELDIDPNTHATVTKESPPWESSK